MYVCCVTILYIILYYKHYPSTILYPSVQINGDNYQLFGQDEAMGLRMKINGATGKLLGVVGLE